MGDTELLIPNFLLFLNPWFTRKSGQSWCFTGIVLVDVHLNWLHWFLFLDLVGGLLVCQIGCMIFL